MGAARTAGHPADWDSGNLAPKGALHPGRLAFSLGTGVATSGSEQTRRRIISPEPAEELFEGAWDRKLPDVTGACMAQGASMHLA